MPRKTLVALCIFLIAFALRLHHLSELPPGLTHDEANHGREAMDVLDGVFLYYFPLNYGSEPLYSYTVAGSMGLLGKTVFSLRIVNVIFGLGAMALAYLWAERAFDRRTAMLAMALTALSFWPLASSREALRAGMLPFFMAAAVWFFWRFLTSKGMQRKRLVIAFAVCVAAALHIYLAARVAWLLFPLFILYLAACHRSVFRRSWLPTFWGLILAGLLVLPMFLYLGRHPEALTRLDMLDRPLQQLSEGDLAPLLRNSGEALLAFVWPGYGDGFLAYNIPGRPVFDAVSAVFFVFGVLISLWRWRQPNHAILLLWFMIGISPSLITGPTANTTRNLAALPAVYLLPAVGFMAIVDAKWIPRWKNLRTLTSALIVLWLLFVGCNTFSDYFIHWGKSPEVRGAYQHTLVNALGYLKQKSPASSVVISTIFPGPAHDPSIGRVLLPEPSFPMRWVDARYALLLPDSRDALAIIPASTPPHPVLASLLTPLDEVSLRPDDLDPSYTLYQLDAQALRRWELNLRLDFDGAATLMQASWNNAIVDSGDTAEMISIWRVDDPNRIGPNVPPANTTDTVLFTQVLNEVGQVLTQRDSLEAPSWDWRAGDIVIQIHQVTVPEDTAPGTYDTIIGMYERASGVRHQVYGSDGQLLDDHAQVMPLRVKNP